LIPMKSAKRGCSLASGFIQVVSRIFGTEIIRAE
jgi:hypothetical protein